MTYKFIPPKSLTIRKFRLLQLVSGDENLKSTSALPVLFALLTRMNNNDLKCFPSIETIADDIGCLSTRTIQRSIQALVDRQWIYVRYGNGRNGTNTYSFNWQRVDNPIDPYDQTLTCVSPFMRGYAGQKDKLGVTSMTETVTSVSELPDIRDTQTMNTNSEQQLSKKEARLKACDCSVSGEDKIQQNINKASLALSSYIDIHVSNEFGDKFDGKINSDEIVDYYDRLVICENFIKSYLENYSISHFWKVMNEARSSTNKLDIVELDELLFEWFRDSDDDLFDTSYLEQN